MILIQFIAELLRQFEHWVISLRIRRIGEELAGESSKLGIVEERCDAPLEDVDLFVKTRFLVLMNGSVEEVIQVKDEENASIAVTKNGAVVVFGVVNA